MKTADWEVLSNYVRLIRDQLGLRDWFLVVKHDPPADQAALASVTCIEGRRFATVRVCVDFRELMGDEQRHVIIHELLHCHLAEMHHYLNGILRDVLGQSSVPILGAHHMKVEYAVDAIAQEWATTFPLIEWTTADPDRDEAANAPAEFPIDIGVPS